MRIDLLMSAQEDFLFRYPEGFNDPELQQLRKKHNTAKLQDYFHTSFNQDSFGFTEEVMENMIRVIGRSSMVSLFEKPKFRDFIHSLSSDKKDLLSSGLYELLYGNQETGFNQMIVLLEEGRLAKWTIISTFLYYSSPEEEVFCKPTTVKNILRTFEITHLVYKPKPNYAFYVGFRKLILEIKAICSPLIGAENAKITGFLWMTLPTASTK